MFWFRLTGSDNSILRFYSKLMHIVLSKRYNIYIPIGTRIGYGFYLSHGTSVIINPTAIIGNNCNVSQFTTIGSNRGKAAVIGDNTYIGPSVSLVEDIVIGSNCIIGAGSVVLHSFPESSTIVSNPARLVRINTERNPFIINPWVIKDEKSN